MHIRWESLLAATIPPFDDSQSNAALKTIEPTHGAFTSARQSRLRFYGDEYVGYDTL